MPNHVSVIDNNIIYMVLEGDQKEAEFLTVSQQTEQLARAAEAAGRPVFVLVNVSKVGKISLAVRQAAAHNLRNLPLDRAAIFGAKTYLKHLANLVIMATGHKGARVFDTEKEARAWLMQ